MKCYLVACAAFVALTGCQSEDAATTATDTVQQQPAEQGGMSDDEAARATNAAHEAQATVTGTFIGATAVAVDETPSDLGLLCSSTHLIRVRVVWNSDASFHHAGLPNGLPDGPRKALLLWMDADSGDACGQGAMYRDVDPHAGEVLFYGSRA